MGTSIGKGGKLNEGKLMDRCVEGYPNWKMRVPFKGGSSKDGTPMPGLPEIPANKYYFDGGKIHGLDGLKIKP